MGKYHVRETRMGYEFDADVRWQVHKDQEGKCAWPGCNKPIEQVHHILPIAVARKYFPHVLHLVMLRENALGYCTVHHKKEHKQSHDYGEIAMALNKMSKRERV